MESKYMLIEVIEREVTTPKEYDSFKKAQAAMFKYISEAIGEPVKSVWEAYQAGEVEDKFDVHIYDNNAYCEVHGYNFDWHIFMLVNGEWQKASVPTEDA